MPKRLTTYVDKGMVDTMLPYTQQDFYDRQRKMRMFKGIYLENDHLKAVFLPELGGRLWSLWDKDAAPVRIKNEGRLKLYTAVALTRLGRLEEAAGYLNYDLVVLDIKEDENSITEAWFALCGAILQKRTGITDPAALHQMVEKEYPPGKIGFQDAIK